MATLKKGKFIGVNYFVAIVFAAILVLTSCKTTRIVSQKPTEIKPVDQVISKIRNAQPNFRTANISKLTMEVQLGQRQVDVSAGCKIRLDSAIYLSVQPFMGIELYKVEMMPDSIRIFDKMNNRFYAVDYGFFQKKFGVQVDFYSLQSLLTGRFFCIGNKGILTDSCRLTAPDVLAFNYKNIQQSTQFSPDNTLKQVVLKSVRPDYTLQTNYSNYSRQDSITFPKTINFTATGENKNMRFSFDLLKADFNRPLIFRPTDTTRFTKGNIEQLLKK